MGSREQEKQWERQSGIGYHLATLLKNLGADDTAKAQLHEHLVLRIVHDLIDARNQLELVWCMMNLKQIIHITNSPEFMTDVLCYYLRATHSYLENHQLPTPVTWDDLKIISWRGQLEMKMKPQAYFRKPDSIQAMQYYGSNIHDVFERDYEQVKVV